MSRARKATITLGRDGMGGCASDEGMGVGPTPYPLPATSEAT